MFDVEWMKVLVLMKGEEEKNITDSWKEKGSYHRSKLEGKKGIKSMFGEINGEKHMLLRGLRGKITNCK